ncbi:MAG: hypothetical protein WC238_05235 [Parcubacteria group bacterium]|jgi:hypothetical protein
MEVLSSDTFKISGRQKDKKWDAAFAKMRKIIQKELDKNKKKVLIQVGLKETQKGPRS